MRLFTAERIVSELENSETLDDAIMFFKEQVDNSGSAWKLSSGVYQVAVDKAAPNSKDHSCCIWMKKGISGKMIIVAEYHYR